MKILKAGTVPVIAYVGTCTTCQCKIECERHEVQWLADRPWEPSSAYYECPFCTNGKLIWLSERKEQ